MMFDLKSRAFGEAQARFQKTHPEYERTRKLDELRAKEYTRLDAAGHIYLDYTGGGLYADSQIREHQALLAHGVFGNPHSTSPASMAMTRLVEQCRRHVLDFFRASPDEYVVIFTLNASGALRLVGESYPFEPEDQFLLTFDNHNSVNGIREFTRTRRATTTYVPMPPPEMRVDEAVLDRLLDGARPNGHNLFAYPAQSNFSGVQHPLTWIPKARDKGWDVLLDAAAFVPTNRLDLSEWHPDFVTLSFYKMFGYPTGVGALIARQEALLKLRRPWFAGGTITVASVQAEQHFLAGGAAAFEDGTANYLSLPAVDMGLSHLESVGLDVIHERVRCLTSWLLEELVGLHHNNGGSLVRLYGPTDTAWRGGAVTVNFYDASGQVMDHLQIEEEANRLKISLRTGCFCNPGAGETALGLSKSEISTCFMGQDHLTLEDFRMCIDNKSTGAVRISVGPVTNFADVWCFLEFAKSFLDR